jgi:hypothetical protein
MSKLLFESKTCTRCGGSGQHSYNQRDGTRCFGCNGSGSVLTKRGQEAQRFYTASVTVAQSELVVGDVLLVDGFPFSGSYKARVVSVGDLYEYGQSLHDGAWVPNLGRKVELVNVKTGETSGRVGPDSSTFRKVFSAEETAAKRAAALAYQATLTVAGTVAKRKGAVAARA